MVDVKGKWAFITGASRGLGSKIAAYMAMRGCNLILHSRSLDGTKQLADELAVYGVECKSIAADLGDESAVKAMLLEIDSFNLDVAIVFNNAGLQIAYHSDYFNTPVYHDFETSFKVNIMAPAMICYHFLPKMIDKGFGRVINTTSGIDKEPEQAAYSASKAALDKYTKDLASKLDGTDVMLNLVDPGWCQTDMGGSSAPNSPDSALPGLVLGAFLDDKKSGRLIAAQEFAGVSLEEALSRF